MELIDYASIAVLLYITFTFLTRAILIVLYAYFIREWMKDDDKPTERFTPPNYDGDSPAFDSNLQNYE